MPRGYVLDNLDDAKRAMFRKIYTEQIKQLSGAIKKMGFYNSDVYGIVIDSVKAGIYENLGDLFHESVHTGRNRFLGTNKSSIPQDFMSPLELRLNSVAIKRALEGLDKFEKSRFSLQDVRTIGYEAGTEIASEFRCLKTDLDGQNMSAKSPTLNVQPIIKQYNKSLVLGTLPKGQIFTTTDPFEKDGLVYRNVDTFGKIKQKLIELGMVSSAQRVEIFTLLNSNYYDISLAPGNHAEICYNLMTNEKIKDYISPDELFLNFNKLHSFYQSISTLNRGASRRDICNMAVISGDKARELAMTKRGVLPELLNGFYYTYSELDKKKELYKLGMNFKP